MIRKAFNTLKLNQNIYSFSQISEGAGFLQMV